MCQVMQKGCVFETIVTVWVCVPICLIFMCSFVAKKWFVIKPNLKDILSSKLTVHMTVLPTIGKSPVLSQTVLSFIFQLHIGQSLSFPFIVCCPWSSPPLRPSICNLPHATYTFTMPITTGARSHCLALWHFPSLSENREPEAGSFSISLSQGPVGQLCDRWALAGDCEPLCCSTQLDGVREHWLWCYSWHGWICAELMEAGEDKRHQGYGWAPFS